MPSARRETQPCARWWISLAITQSSSPWTGNVHSPNAITVSGNLSIGISGTSSSRAFVAASHSASSSVCVAAALGAYASGVPRGVRAPLYAGREATHR